eukprot:COSAG01_NODE_1846_length_9050_cov_10.563991_2_plen_84_part_00
MTLLISSVTNRAAPVTQLAKFTVLGSMPDQRIPGSRTFLSPSPAGKDEKFSLRPAGEMRCVLCFGSLAAPGWLLLLADQGFQA